MRWFKRAPRDFHFISGLPLQNSMNLGGPGLLCSREAPNRILGACLGISVPLGLTGELSFICRTRWRLRDLDFPQSCISKGSSARTPRTYCATPPLGWTPGKLCDSAEPVNSGVSETPGSKPGSVAHHGCDPEKVV